MKYLFILLLSFASLNIHAQGIFKSNEGEVSFLSEAALENIEAHNKNFSSFINTTSKEVVFVIPVRNFKFQKSLMEEHFNEKYMESDKYPDATFQGKINEDIDFTKEGDYKVTATGKMKMHGVEKVVTSPGTLTVKNGTLALQSSFNVALKDYNITIPRLVIQNIAEVIPVKVVANYVPYKK